MVDSEKITIDPKDVTRRIRKGLVILLDLSSALDKMPEGDARIELQAKHDEVFMRVNDLQATISDYDPKMCWYGFSASCYGGCCDDCPDLNKIVKLNKVVYVDDFDKERMENARKYYQEEES
jgi:hypothetical protein